jgi:hypothetical protein
VIIFILEQLLHMFCHGPFHFFLGGWIHIDKNGNWHGTTTGRKILGENHIDKNGNWHGTTTGRKILGENHIV